MNISLAREYRSLNSYQKTRIVEFYYKNKDIREIIYNIKEVNNLESSSLYVNQELMIPIV